MSSNKINNIKTIHIHLLQFRVLSKYLVCGPPHYNNLGYYPLFVAENSFAFGAIVYTRSTFRTSDISTQMRGRRCHGRGYICCSRGCRPVLDKRYLHNLTCSLTLT